MIRRRTGRTVSVIFGIALVVVLLFAALQWRELVVRYHVLRLRRDPSYLHGIVSQPDGTPARAAIREWVCSDLLGSEGVLAPRERPWAGQRFRRQTAVVLPGDFPTVHLLEFLAEHTGLPVVANVEALSRTLNVRSEVPDLDAQVAVALLAAEGGRVGIDSLPNQRQVLRVLSAKTNTSSLETGTRSRAPLPSSAPGVTAALGAGNIPVGWLGRVLEVWTGVSVQVDKAIENRTVTVVAEIQEADGEIIRALLEAQGFEVVRRRRDDRQQTLRIKAAAPTSANGDSR